MKPISKIWHQTRRTGRDLIADCSALAAVEFAFILPLMLVLFFGTVEFSQGIAVDRKLSLTARTLSDLTGQAATPMNDTYLQNIFTAGIAIMTPYQYPPTPFTSQISEIYIDSTGVATVQWSKGAYVPNGANQATLTSSSRNAGDTVTGIIPSQLLVKQTYLILSEISYQYVPTIGYVMAKTGINLSDVAYTRPRQNACVVYNNLPVLTNGTCPTP